MQRRRQFIVALAGACGLGPLALWLSARTGSNAVREPAYPVQKSERDWRATLSAERYRILRGQGTERSFTSPLNAEKRQGTFVCAGCGHPLFSSETKFESGTGWPSFWQPLDGAIGTEVDRRWLMVRTEVHCARCGGHLGHVFPDGPAPTGLRYCMNGLALVFEAGRGAVGPGLQKATFAGGCFWCVEADFDTVAGVVTTTSGYTGGRVADPGYEQVSRGGTGHAEAVEVTFDPAVVSYEQLLDRFWHNVDPFVAHRQFCDVGDQYRPEIFVHSVAQRAAAEASRARLQMRFTQAIVVKVTGATTFYPAEAYHQDYHNTHQVRYRFYRWSCGRDARLESIWGDT